MHSAVVGNHCIAAKVDGEPVPLGTVLRNGNRVEIITDPQARPNPVWLSYVATGKARSHIRHYLKTMQLQESAEVGELLLVQALRSLKANPDEIGEGHWARFFKGDAAKSREEVMADIGLGKRLAVVVAKKMRGMTKELSNAVRYHATQVFLLYQLKAPMSVT